MQSQTVGLTLDIKEVAKLIRRELKIEFPSTTFKVRIDRFSQGEGIDVLWVDGPQNSKVEAILNKYDNSEYMRYVQGQRRMSEGTRAELEKGVDVNDYGAKSKAWASFVKRDF